MLHLHVVFERRDFGWVFEGNLDLVQNVVAHVVDRDLLASPGQRFELLVVNGGHLADPLGHVAPDVRVGELVEGNGPADVVPLGGDGEAEIAVPFEVIKLELALEAAVGLAGNLADKRQVVFDCLGEIEGLGLRSERGGANFLRGHRNLPFCVPAVGWLHTWRPLLWGWPGRSGPFTRFGFNSLRPSYLDNLMM